LIDAHKQAIARFMYERERQSMIEEITEKVIERIHLNVETKEAIAQIEALREELESLYSMFYDRRR
jgi:uncharacterized protein (UPF0305 family)